MKNWKTHLVIAAVLATAVAILGTVFAQPVWAQVRAALVRDTDNPDLAPFQAGINTTINAVNT
jgi:hypothetical protein